MVGMIEEDRVVRVLLCKNKNREQALLPIHCLRYQKTPKARSCITLAILHYTTQQPLWHIVVGHTKHIFSQSEPMLRRGSAEDSGAARARSSHTCIVQHIHFVPRGTVVDLTPYFEALLDTCGQDLRIRSYQGETEKCSKSMCLTQ